jgi:uncharacterized protein YerC
MSYVVSLSWVRITVDQICDKFAAINYISEFTIDTVRLIRNKRKFIGITAHNSITTTTVSVISRVSCAALVFYKTY